MLIVQELLGYVLLGGIGLLLAAVAYIPIYLILRKKVPLARQLARFLLVVCVLVISAATFLETMLTRQLASEALFSAVHTCNLIPFRFLTDAWAMGARKQLTQTLANVLMFVPFGFFVPLAFPKWRTFKQTVWCAALFSFFIEFTQYWIGRSADIDDLLLNTLGGVCGYVIFCGFQKLCWKLHDKR